MPNTHTQIYIYIYKGNGNKCENYEGIASLICIHKVLSSIVSNILTEYTEKKMVFTKIDSDRTGEQSMIYIY